MPLLVMGLMAISVTVAPAPVGWDTVSGYHRDLKRPSPERVAATNFFCVARRKPASKAAIVAVLGYTATSMPRPVRDFEGRQHPEPHS